MIESQFTLDNDDSHFGWLYVSIYIYMVTDRIMGKKNVQLRQAAPASDFSIIGFFPIRVQNIPEVIRTFFFS